MNAASYPPFVARAPWWGADLQTLRNYLSRNTRDGLAASARRLELAVDDGTGDRLVAVLNRPDKVAAGAPLVMLVHGLSGCESSVYMMATAAVLVAAGCTVLRLNLRGAGPSRPLCREHYHAGRSDDLRAALAVLPAELLAAGVVAVGYSLGGSVLLKHLGERPASVIVGAVTVSAPLDLAAGARRLKAARNTVYHRWLLARLVKESLAPTADLTAAEVEAIKAATSLYAFDDRYVAPRYGFGGADDYYRRCSAAQFLPAITVPTLLIHARNDPWIPAAPYDRVPWAALPCLQPLLVRGGGHVGFHGRGRGPAWHDRCILRFLDRIVQHDSGSLAVRC